MARLVSMNYCLWLLADREAPDHSEIWTASANAWPQAATAAMARCEVAAASSVWEGG